MQKQYKIYQLTEPDGLEVRHIYIGFTTRSLDKRVMEHIWYAKKKNYYLCNWIKKLAQDGLQPKISLLRITDEDHWEQDEINEIKKARDTQFKTGIKVLNILDGGQHGNLGRIVSEATRKKISNAKKGKKPPQQVFDGWRKYYEKNGNPRKGVKLSKETKSKMSESLKGNKCRVGTTHSEESKVKIANSRSVHGLEMVNKARAMLEEGKSQTKIAKELGVSRWFVQCVQHHKGQSKQEKAA